MGETKLGPKDRIEILKKLLGEENPSTQEELSEKLEKAGFAVTQSTVSRDLRKLGAIRATDSRNQIVYKLPTDSPSLSPLVKPSLTNLIIEMKANDSMIVVHTTPGSASLVARHLDSMDSASILGTIAGDDTVFIAVHSTVKTKIVMQEIRKSL